MEKRIFATACIAIALFAVLQGRLMMLATNAEYISAQKSQSEYILPINSTRGNIFDCNFLQLTNTEKVPYALISPGEKNYKLLFDSVASGAKNGFYRNSEKYMPFLIAVNKNGVKKADYIFYSSKRYLTLPIAPQLIGYIDNKGNGISGVELAFDSVLRNSEQANSVKVVTNARGEIIAGKQPELLSESGTGSGIMLCMDSRIQRICEAVAKEKIDKGAILVMETKTGRIKASVSMPIFDPSDTSKSLTDENAPFINRNISQFTAGSVFKPLLAAVALENGYGKNEIYNCEGYIDINGHIYRCAHGKGHGEVNMEKALMESCNCYFVNLGRFLGGDKLYSAAALAGFGDSTVFAGNILTAKGNLPSPKILKNTGELANFSFGQGQLTVTPAQVTAFMNIFSNNGIYISPSFVEGVVNQNMREITQSVYRPMQRQVFSPEVSAEISGMLEKVVSAGLAVKAKPLTSTAAGKTGTAQTGRINENGDEFMDAWFSGYFPAINPKYTITVLLDDGLHGSDDACEVFADIVNALNLLSNNIDK